MLTFFRKNALVVGWAIVAVFVISMFGGLFLMKTSQTGMRHPEKPKDTWAYIGNIPVNQTRFQEIFAQSLAPYGKEGGLQLDPQMIEILQFSAFMQAVQYTVLYEGAVQAKVKPTSQEMDAQLQQVYVQYDLKDEKALKEALKKNNYDFDAFMDYLKADVITQKFMNGLQANIQLTNQDVDNMYTQIRVQHMVFRPSADVKLSEVESRAKAAAEALAKGKSFEEVLKQTTQDPAVLASQGDLGWVRVGMLPRALEKAAFSLGKGEWTPPIQSYFGYHIVKLTDRRELERPASINYVAEKQKLLPLYQKAAAESYIQAFLERNPLDIKEPALAAYYYKSRGDMPAAINAYQAQISKSPYDPRPHYLLAQLYMGQDVDAALTELKKAKVKIGISPSLDFSGLHLLEGDLLKKTGQSADAEKAYDEAIRVGELQMGTLGYLQAFFKDRGDTVRAQRVERLKTSLEAKMPTQNQVQQTAR